VILARKRQGTRMLFATDLHGSESAFRKFLAARKQTKASVLLLGGDLTGKILVPVVEHDGVYTAEFMGRELRAADDAELVELESTLRLAGQYPVHMTEQEIAWLHEHPEELEGRFVAAMRESLQRWFDLAAERLEPEGIRILAILGNDDPPAVDDVLRGHPYVEAVEDEPVLLEDGIAVVGFSGSNRTPWHSPREFTEDEIHARLGAVVEKLGEARRSIWNVHVPPYDTGLDTVAEVTDDLQVVMRGGQPNLIPAGSTAVRELIERHQPILALHGHVHECRAVGKVGSAVVVNPGSEYTEGVLRAAVITVDRERASAQLMATL
jgi:Icc-related predicted phosphoesterase